MEAYSTIDSIINQIGGFEDSKYFQGKDYYRDGNEELPYIIMADLTRYYEEQVRLNKEDVLNSVHTYLISLLHSKDPDLITLCTVGFLESLNPEGKEYERIKKLLPRELLDQLIRIEKFWNMEVI